MRFFKTCNVNWRHFERGEVAKTFNFPTNIYVSNTNKIIFLEWSSCSLIKRKSKKKRDKKVSNTKTSTSWAEIYKMNSQYTDFFFWLHLV